MGKYKKAFKKLNKAIANNDHVSHELTLLSKDISNQLKKKKKDTKKKQCKTGHYFKGNTEIIDCYTIVVKRPDSDKYVGSPDNDYSCVNEELHKYEFGETTSCGKCWQETSIHGSYNLDYMKEYCDCLNRNIEAISAYNWGFGFEKRYDKVEHFRIKHIHIERESELIKMTPAHSRL